MHRLHVLIFFNLIASLLCAVTGACNTKFSGFHTAHAVSGGPYVVTDFNGRGFASVKLDGTGSHSHATKNGNSGHIKKYSWSWAIKGKIKYAAGSKPAPFFPRGTTTLSLTVWDQFGNCAKENTKVFVEPAAKSGAYCYFYDYGNSNSWSVPIPFSKTKAPKPKYGRSVGALSFPDIGSFGMFNFKKNSFAVRCIFSLLVKKAGMYSYSVVHNGPIRVIWEGETVAQKGGFGWKKTMTKGKWYKSGLHNWQVHYFRKQFSPGLLKFQGKTGGHLPAGVIRYDTSTALPIITGLSRTSAFENEVIRIYGLSFINNVVVKFGNKIAQPVTSSAGMVEVKVPPKTGASVVDVFVRTNAGTSNHVNFRYLAPSNFCSAPKWKTTSLLTAKGKPYSINNVAVIKYGPDGRLYLGTQWNYIHALTISRSLKVTKKCTKNVKGPFPRRWILGIAFNPKSTSLKMYFSSSTLFWNSKKYGTKLPFNTGWNNGRIQQVTISGPNACFGDVKNIVIGLPVGNIDHGVNFLQFLPNGRLLVSVAGATNGGISAAKQGGIPESPLSGAILSCPADRFTQLKYTNPAKPGKTKVSGDCKVWAPGFRNSFGAELHTNGWLYAMDNGANWGFGAFSTNCYGGNYAATNMPDRFFKVIPGKCHGHPNFARGQFDKKQCKFHNPQCAKPLLGNIKSSTNGVLEYRSNVFNGKYKGDIFLTRFSQSPGKKGSVSRVQINKHGTHQSVTKNFFDDSGLSIVEGPRGEMVMSRVYKKTFLVRKPICSGQVNGPYLIGVHPKRGPAAGGHTVLISGFNFGSSPKAFFGGKRCTEVRRFGAESFTCKTPRGAPGLQVTVKIIASGKENMQKTGPDYWYW